MILLQLQEVKIILGHLQAHYQKQVRCVEHNSKWYNASQMTKSFEFLIRQVLASLPCVTDKF
jgi:hypothetical protein